METQGLPFKIDACYRSDEELAQFAAIMEHVTPEMQAHLEECMGGNESEDFYHGLMAGYAASVALAQQVPVDKYTNYVRIIVTFLASKLRKMGK